METSIIFHKVSEWSKDRIWKYDRWGYQSDKEKKKAEMKTLIRLGKVGREGGERELIAVEQTMKGDNLLAC